MAEAEALSGREIASLARRGSRLLELTARQSNWILRRSERIRFDDSLTLNRESTLDISVSRLHREGRELVPSRLPTQGNRLLLPVGSFSRTGHYDIQVAKSDGSQLLFLPRSKERRLLAAAFARVSLDGHAYGSVASRQKQLIERFHELLDFLNRDSPIDDDDENFPEDAPQYMKALSGFRPFRRNYLIIVTPLITEVFGGRAGWDLHPGLLRLIERHSEVIPGISSYTFSAEAARYASMYESCRTGWSVSGSHPVAIDTESSIWNRPRRTEDVAIEIPASQTMCQSLHVSVSCSPNTYIDDSNLIVVAESADDDGQVSPCVVQIADDDVHRDSSHFYFAHRLLEEKNSLIVDSRLMLVLRPRYHGLIRPGQNLALLTVIIMFIYTFTLGWRATGWPGLFHVTWVKESSAEPVTALLLGALTIALGVTIRPDEHEMTRFVATRFRRHMAGVMLAALVPVIAIAIGIGGVTEFWLLLASSLIALVYLINILISASYSHRRGDEKPYPTPPTYESTPPESDVVAGAHDPESGI